MSGYFAPVRQGLMSLARAVPTTNWKAVADALESWTKPGTVAITDLGDMTSDRLLGRDTAGTGGVEELTVSGGLEFSGAGGIRRSALTGDVTAAAGSNTTTIANDAVTFAKMQNLSTDRLIGRDTAGTGDAEEISLTGGLEFSGSQSIRIADSGVVAGTYTLATVTVDATGRVTSASSGATPSSWIPLVDGVEPPGFITDGGGSLILVAYP